MVGSIPTPAKGSIALLAGFAAVDGMCCQQVHRVAQNAQGGARLECRYPEKSPGHHTGGCGDGQTASDGHVGTAA